MIKSIKHFIWKLFHRHFIPCHRVFLSDGWHNLKD
jgi:hypothetical protein